MKILYALLIIPALSLAQSCPTKNLITAKNSPFKDMPVYDQNGAGICFAYATSQLLNYHYIKQGSKSKVVHPAWVGLAHAKAVKQEKIQAGYPEIALKAVLKYSNCPYDVVTDSIKEWSMRAKVSESDLLSFIDIFRDKYFEVYSRTPGKKHDVRKEVSTAIFEIMMEKKFSCKAPQFQNLIDFIEPLARESATSVVANMFNPACKLNSGPFPSQPKIQHHNFKTEGEYNWAIRSRLEALDAPISISYCSDFWRNPGSLSIKANANRMRVSDKDLEPQCGAHESIVVGQKDIGGSCHFLIRNSWGSQWGAGNENYKCVCQNIFDGSYIDNCTKKTHDNSLYVVEACWVDAKVVSANTFGITHLGEYPLKASPPRK